MDPKRRHKFGLTVFLGLSIALGTACSRSEERSFSQGPQVEKELDFTPQAEMRLELGAKSYADCEDLQSSVRSQLLLKKKSDAAQNKYWADYWEKNPGMKPIVEEVALEEAASDAKEDSITNVQELGVDEEDFVKVSGDSIYVLRRHGLEVIDRKSLKRRGTLSLQDSFGAQVFNSFEITSLKMYADSGRLAIVGQYASKDPYPYARSSDLIVGGYEPTHSAVKVLLLQTRTQAMPEKIEERTFNGDYVDSRLTAHHLYLVIRDYLPLVEGNLESAVTDHPVITVDNKVRGVPCQNIGRQKIQDLDFTMSKIVSLDMQNPERESFLTAMLGGGDQIYMSLDSIYITKFGYAWRPWVAPGQAMPEDAFETLDGSLLVSKLALRPEQNLVSLEADGIVKGYVRNQFHLKEYAEEGVLAVATTSYQEFAPNFAGQMIGQGLNHLWILRQEANELKVVNGLYRFGEPGEDLRSVRFSGDYAYMVTFKKTDPLYVFNMSDPTAPRLEGELKIPGFSMYLHPVSGQRLVGVGYDADDEGEFAWYQGVQVSLFDASQPTALRRLDNKIHGQRGSYTDVTGNHHAFHYDAESHIFTLPIVELVGKEADLGPDYGSRLRFSGAVAYRVEDEGLRLVGRASHRDLIPEACLSFLNQGQWWQHEIDSLDINRMFKLDGRWLSISRFGLKVHDADQRFQPSKTLTFKGDLSRCS